MLGGQSGTAGPFFVVKDSVEHQQGQSIFSEIPFLKAQPVEEGGERFLFIEPSRPTEDVDGEAVPRETLLRSSDYFLKYGNIDLYHFTHPWVAKQLGIPNPREFEVGRPKEVRLEPNIFVKAQLFRGSEKADWLWRTMHDFDPPMPWYPSVGGTVLKKNPNTGEVNAAVWDNIGLDPKPKNLDVPQVTTVPPAAFLKAITSGGGITDIAALTDGGALRCESLHGARDDRDYHRIGSALIKTVEGGELYLGEEPTPADVLAGIVEYFMHHGCDRATANDFARRWVAEVGGRIRRAQQGALAAAA